jgi:uncharacterized delta-60 repeat protein
MRSIQLLLLLLVLVLTFGITGIGLASDALNPLWTRFQDGPPAHVDDQAAALVVDPAGNVYVTGTSGLILDDLDYSTVKYSPNGDVLWARRYDAPNPTNSSDNANAIALDGMGNIAVTGYCTVSGTDHDYVTIKYTAAGDSLWVRGYDGTAQAEDIAYAIAADEDGNTYVTGASVGVNAEQDVVTIKYTPTGSVAWIRRLDGPAHRDDEGFALALDGLGSLYVAAWYFMSTGSWDYATIKYDLDGNMQWIRTYNGTGNSGDNPFAVSIDPNGNVVVAGRSSGQGSSFDYATVKYDPQGNLLWARRHNGTANSRDDGYGMTIDALGNVYVTGFSVSSGSQEDILTIKYTSAGDSVWVRGYDGSGHADDYAYNVVKDHLGYVYVTGTSAGSGTSYDIATIAYSPDGELVGEARVDGSAHGYDQPGSSNFPSRSLAVDAQRNVYMTGFVSNTTTFSDFITVKYAPTVTGLDDSAPESAPRLAWLGALSPNPLVRGGTVEFTLAGNSPVTLDLYDPRGSAVRRILTAARLQAGIHRVPLEAAGLPSGVYFLRLSAQRTTDIRKLVVLE